MHPLTPPDSLSPRRILAQGFAERYAGKPTSVDEMTESNGSLRPYWQPFLSMLDELGPRELGKRWEQARRFIHDNGVSHNVYGDPNGLDRPWSLDLIPLLIPSLQWERLSEGLVQRAQLLDRLLADLYGPGETVLTGLLPPELLWANMGFLRPCHGVDRAGWALAASLRGGHRAPGGRRIPGVERPDAGSVGRGLFP